MKILTLLSLLLPFALLGQQQPVTVQNPIQVTNSPSGSCSNAASLQQVTGVGIYQCISGAWALVGAPPGTGSVTSVGLTFPSTFCATGSPVTSSGNLSCTLATGQTANQIFGTDSSGAVGLMALAVAQLPTIPLTSLASIAGNTVLGVSGGTSSTPEALSAAALSTILGLGTAATVNIGTSGSTLGLLNSDLTFSGTNAYGTPSSINLANATFPASGPGAGTITGITTSSPLSGSGTSGSVALSCPTCATSANNLGFFAATTSAQLAGILSDETGTGSAVFSISPVFTTPNLGTPSALVLTNATGLPHASVIGLGTAALVNTGTSGGTVGLLNANLTFSGTNAYGTPASIDLVNATALPFSSVSSGTSTNALLIGSGGSLGVSGSGTIDATTLEGIASSGFDVAGAAATAQSNAETFAANASNISSGTIGAARVPTLNQNTTGNAGTATALATLPSQAPTGQYCTGITAAGNCNAAQVNYSQLAGTPVPAAALGTVALTAQTTGLGPTTIATPATGTYQACGYLVTTATGSAGTASLSFGWNDGTQAESDTPTKLTAVSLTALGEGQGCTFMRTNGTAITYTTVLTSALGSPAYSVYISLRTF